MRNAILPRHDSPFAGLEPLRLDRTRLRTSSPETRRKPLPPPAACTVLRDVLQLAAVYILPPVLKQIEAEEADVRPSPIWPVSSLARLQPGPFQPRSPVNPARLPAENRTPSNLRGRRPLNVSTNGSRQMWRKCKPKKTFSISPLKVSHGYLILIIVRRRTGSKVWTDRSSAARRAGKASRCASGVFSAKREASRTASHPRTAFVKCNSSSLCFNGAAQLSSSLLRREEKPAGSPSLRVFLCLNACSSTLGVFNRTNTPFL